MPLTRLPEDRRGAWLSLLTGLKHLMVLFETLSTHELVP